MIEERRAIKIALYLEAFAANDADLKAGRIGPAEHAAVDRRIRDDVMREGYLAEVIDALALLRGPDGDPPG